MKLSRLKPFLWGTMICSSLYGAARTTEIIMDAREGRGPAAGALEPLLKHFLGTGVPMPKYDGEMVVGGASVAELAGVMGVMEDAGGATTGVRALFPTMSAQTAKKNSREIVMQDVRHAGLDPEIVSDLERSAVSLHTAGRLDEAIDAYVRAIKDSPKDAGLHLNLGIAYYQKGLLENARSQLGEASRLGARVPSQLAEAIGLHAISGAAAQR